MIKVEAIGARARMGVAIARATGIASRGWGQRGLGTAYAYLGRLLRMQDAYCWAEISRDAWFRTGVLDPYWAPSAISGRAYEPEVAAALRLFAGERTLFVDCGANFGYWSVLATSPAIGFPRGLSVEPNPVTFAILQANADRNRGRFRCLQRAISDVSGQTVTLDRSDHHALTRVALPSEGHLTGPQVKTVTVDDAIAEEGIPADWRVVLKVDIEGLEEEAIRGASATLERHDHAIVFECWTNQSNLRRMLESGRVVFIVRPDGSALEVHPGDDVSAILFQRPGARLPVPQNLVTVRRGGVFHERLLQRAR